jgi:hypothetical protein
VRIRKNKSNKILFFFYIFVIISILTVLANFTPGLKGSIDQELRILFKQNDRVLSTSLKVTSKNLYNSFKLWSHNEKKYETFKIDISYKNLKILREERKKALKINYNLSRKKIPIQINYNNNKYKATARLKGGLSDHYGNNKQFSLMIKLKGKKLINGMNEFALTQHYTRQFPNNLFYSELLSSMGLSMPRYITYKINLNGDDWGLMLAEEHYSSEYYKLRNKNYSPTIKFTNEDNSDLRRSLYANFNTNINDKILKFLDYRHGKIENKIFNRKDFKDPKFSNIISYLRDVKYDLIKNKINNSELDTFFDMEKFSKVFILAILSGDYHALGYRNIRFYYNENTKKLEPIPTDWGLKLRLLKNEKQLETELYNVINCFKGCTYHNHVIYDKIIKNEIFQQYFKTSLNIFLKEININKHKLNFLCEFQINCLNKFDLKTLENNLAFIKNKTNYISIFNKTYSTIEKPFSNLEVEINEKVKRKYFEFLNNAVYIRAFSNGSLKIINLTPYPIEIYSIKLRKKDCSKKKNKELFNSKCFTIINRDLKLSVTDLEFFKYNLEKDLQNYESITVYSKYNDFKLNSSKFYIEDKIYSKSAKYKNMIKYRELNS